MKTKTDLDKIVNDGYSFDFGQTFDEILDYFKKTFLLNGLILLIVSLGIALLVFFAITLGSFANSLTDISAIETLLANPLIFATYIGGAIIFSILIAPLYAGFLQLNRDIDTSNEVGVSSIFKHYSSKSLGQIIVCALIIQVISLLASLIPVFNLIASILIYWFTVLAVPLIIFNNFTAVDALNYSVKIVAKNPGNILLIIIVSFLISLAGLLAICIGIIFTIPIMYSAQYVLYKKCIGFDDEIVFDIEKKNDFDQTINDIEKDIENL